MWQSLTYLRFNDLVVIRVTCIFGIQKLSWRIFFKVSWVYKKKKLYTDTSSVSGPTFVSERRLIPCLPVAVWAGIKMSQMLFTSSSDHPCYGDPLSAGPAQSILWGSAGGALSLRLLAPSPLLPERCRWASLLPHGASGQGGYVLKQGRQVINCINMRLLWHLKTLCSSNSYLIIARSVLFKLVAYQYLPNISSNSNRRVVFIEMSHVCYFR